ALIVVGLLIAALRGRALPAATPHTWTPPPAPAEGRLSVCWIELGRHRTLGGFARAGWSHSAVWDVTVSGLLVRHAGGDVLVDAGNSAHFAEEIRELRWWPRQLMRMGPGSVTVLAHAPDALAAVGEPLERLRAIVISHVHPDHAGGVV